MLVIGLDYTVNEWINDHGGGRAPKECVTLGYERNGNLVGGAAFYWENGVNCWVNAAIDPTFNPRPLLFACLRYAFGQLALRRLTFLISSGNLPSIRNVEGLGARHEATLREAQPNGDQVIYSLFREACPYLEVALHGRRRRCTEGSGLPTCNPPSK